MTDTYVIQTVFKAQDQMESTINTISGRAKQMGSSLERAFKKGTFGATQFKTVLGGVLGANLITAGLGRLRQGISSLTDEFLDFDAAITSAASKYKFDRGTKEFEALGKAARDVAATTPYTAGQSAKALDYLAMAGFHAEQAMAALPGVTNLAIAGQMDLAQASDIASDAISALGLMSKDPAVLATNLNRVNDVMAKVANTANTDIPMLWEALKPSASVATQLGGSLEELGAMFGTLASSGTKAETAGTALRNMYLRLTSGTREVDKVLKHFNIDIQDQHGKLRPMMAILDEMSRKTAKLDDKTRQAAYSHVFGTRAVNSAMILMKAGKDTVDEYADSLRRSSGEANELARRIGESIPNRLAALKSKLIETGLKFIDTFKDKLPGAIDNTIEAVGKIDVAGVVQSITDVIGTVKEYKGEIKALLVGLVAYNVAMKTAAIVQGVLNVLMTSNPIGLLITAFAILAATIYAVYENWDKLVRAFKHDMGDWSMLGGSGPGQDVSGNSWDVFGGSFFGTKGTPAQKEDVADISQKSGYILGGKKSEADIAALVTKRDQEKTGALANQQNNKQLYSMLKDTGVNSETLAYMQKIAFDGKLTFANAPEGMKFEQTTKGAPPLQTNLGQQ